MFVLLPWNTFYISSKIYITVVSFITAVIQNCWFSDL